MSDIVRAALEALAATGPVTPSRLVAEAADPEHPLHDRFEWDDSAAAHQYRLNQARHVIVSITDHPAGATRRIPVYIHVPSPKGEGEYVAAIVIARQPERWALARDEVLRYLDAATEGLDELDEVLRVYGRPRPQVGRASRAVRSARAEVQAIAS